MAGQVAKARYHRERAGHVHPSPGPDLLHRHRSDADMEVGRMLAQATGAEFQGVTDKDLAQLLEEFSKYF